MDSVYLVKIGEILLKLGNRKEFEDKLKHDLARRLEGRAGRIEYFPGRIFIEAREGAEAEVEAVLSKTPGINGFARAWRVRKTPEAVFEAGLAIAAEAEAAGLRRFKAESRRSDKSFPLGSYELSRDIGAAVLAAHPGLEVDVHNPEFTISAEIRERAYIYGNAMKGLRGLPAGSQGRGLLLLSGGIDSPVAGYLMASRGLRLDAIYFHAYPYTSDEAKQKVIALARVVAGITGGLSLWVVPFTEAQMRIKQRAREDLTTLMMRAAMMEISTRLAERIGANSLVTGESLGQVASQTAENLRFTGSYTNLPVFRPLIGIDKEETIGLARKLGSYETSILPYEDCCVLFSPKHPLLRAELERERAAYAALELESLNEAALRAAEQIPIPFSVTRP
jgi:thiamine biosynthesis protein ThiI